MNRFVALLGCCLVIGCARPSDTIATFRVSEQEFRQVLGSEIDGQFAASEIKPGVRRLTWKSGQADCQADFQRTLLVSAKASGPEAGKDLYRAFGNIAAFCTDDLDDAEFGAGIDGFQSGRVNSLAWKVRHGYVCFTREQGQQRAELTAIASHR